MASIPGTLRITSTLEVPPSTRVLEIERVDGGSFGAVGGKYIIVDTGAPMVRGRAVKRAYSLMPAPGARGRCQLAVKRLGGGPGSDTLHEAAVGTELSFSGPWGKLVPEGGQRGRVLFVATDTGITSALGVAEHLGERDDGGAQLEVLWLRAAGETFLDVASVRARVEAAGARFVHAVIAPVDAPERAAAAWAHVAARIAEHAPETVLGAGDGLIVHPLRARFGAEETGVADVRIECFFHNPERKSG